MAIVPARCNLLSILDCLTTARPEIVLLDSAKRSARKCVFRRPEEVATLLAKFIDYRRLMMQYGDVEARKVFGSRYAAHESVTTRHNKIARNARTFRYEKTSIFMEQHIKIGVKDSEAETLRIYFAWCSVSRRIIIGHCGAHLPLR